MGDSRGSFSASTVPPFQEKTANCSFLFPSGAFHVFLGHRWRREHQETVHFSPVPNFLLVSWRGRDPVVAEVPSSSDIPGPLPCSLSHGWFYCPFLPARGPPHPPLSPTAHRQQAPELKSVRCADLSMESTSDNSCVGCF